MKKGQAHPAAFTSKKLLSAALIELMHEKEQKSITITEICTRSQVSRRTFYRNFHTIDDMLTFFVKDIISGFTAEMKRHEHKTYGEIIVAFFSFWKKHATVIALLNQNGLTHILFIEYIKCLREIPFLCCSNIGLMSEPEVFPVVLAFNAGGLWSLLTYWVTHDCRQTPQELATIITEKL